MAIDRLHALLFATFFGLFLASTGILTDGLFSRTVRRLMALSGCCLILAGVVAL